MGEHLFLFKPSAWVGQGQIQLSLVAEQLTFVTKWTVGTFDAEGRLECEQEVQVKGFPEVMCNQFRIFNLRNGKFDIELENSALGKVRGTGLITEKTVAWEFRVPEIGFEGFEFYEMQDEDCYLMRAEYATDEQFRTSIQGKVYRE